MSTIRPLREERRRKVRALLAAGVVLGIGTATTLAAWTDDAHVATRVQAGTFGIVGSADGSTFAEHESKETAAQLTFQPAHDALTPGRASYALFAVKTAPTSVAGTVRAVADEGNGAAGALATWLTYGLRTVPAATCTAETYSASASIVVAEGAALTASPQGTQALSARGGTTVFYCFKITLRTDAPQGAQGAAAAPAWRFAASSS